MSKLRFKAEAVRRLIDHAASCKEHRPAFGAKAEPALWFVKDEGIYLLSNGKPMFTQDDAPDRQVVIYAENFDPEQRDRMAVWEDARAAVGGDDFCEQLDLSAFACITDQRPLPEWLVFEVTANEIAITAE